MPKPRELAAVNPATGEVLARYPAMDAASMRRAITVADRAFASWRRTEYPERAARLRALAAELRARIDPLARLMALEMGKPVTAGRAEVEKCAAVCEYYAGHGEAFLADQTIPTEAAHSFVTCQPLGVVLAVMPWNFPFWQVLRFAAPAVMAGNVAVLKHASNVPGCALALEDLFRAAGFPDGVFTTLLVGSDLVPGAIRHPQVRAVTLTGSTAAGQAVAREAGRRLKKTVLELGGSDAYLILADADLELAARTCAASRLINSGQSCIAAKRFIVVEAVREEFEARFVAAMAAARVGDPLDPATEVGPQARRDLRDELHDQVQRSIAQGARLLLGGNVPDGPAAYYPPTVLTGVTPKMVAGREELFGPVAAVIPVRNERAAIRAANDSVFGLGGAVFTRDEARGLRIARDELQAGSCFVNALVRSDPRLPFGGIKTSGYGRELGREGIREFVNLKTVYLG